MDSAALLSALVAAFLVGALLLAGFLMRKTIWTVVEIVKPVAEGIGRGIEVLCRRRLPYAAPYDILIHGVMLIAFVVYALVVAINKSPDLVAHLPFLLYIFFGTCIFSFLIAWLPSPPR